MDYVNVLKKEMDYFIGKYEDFLRLLAAGVESPGIGDDASAEEQEHEKDGVRVVGNVDGSVSNHNEEEGSIIINVDISDVNSDNGGNEDVVNNDDRGGGSWDVDLIDGYVLDDDDKED